MKIYCENVTCKNCDGNKCLLNFITLGIDGECEQNTRKEDVEGERE